MAYRLPVRKSISSGLRRLAAKELRNVRVALRRTQPPADAAIHEARKGVKKVRAILALVEADKGHADGAEKKLGKISRALSELRDADAMIATLTELRKRNPGLISEHSFVRLRRGLLSHKRAAMNAAGEKTWSRIDRQLRKLRRAAAGWRPSHRGFGAMVPGLRATHRSGRKAMARARKRQRAADFHEWRKQMKALWYELRLIGDGTAQVRRDVAALHDGERWLGEDHNLVILCAQLSNDRSVCRTPADVERLRLAAAKYQCELRTKAIDRTRHIFARKSGVVVKEAKRAWAARQRREQPAAKRRPRPNAA